MPRIIRKSVQRFSDKEDAKMQGSDGGALATLRHACVLRDVAP
jgi:hypothetical protein